MDLFNHLKRFNKIEPDPQYAAHSRARILAHTQRTRLPFREAALAFLQSGSAMAFAALMLVVLGGGISFVKYLETTGGLDAQSLRAEAQAIDIQIQLADLKYKNFPAEIRAVKPKPAAKQQAAATQASSTPDMTIDEALKALSSM